MAHRYKTLTGMAHDSYNEAIKSLETLTPDLMAASKSDSEKPTDETATSDGDPAQKPPMALDKILEVLRANEVTWLKAWIKAKYGNFNLISMLNNAELNIQSVRQMYHRSQIQLAAAHNKIQELKGQVEDLKGKLFDAEKERKRVTDELDKCRAENEILKKMQVGFASPCGDDDWNEDEPASKRMRLDCGASETNSFCGSEDFFGEDFFNTDNEDEAVGENAGVDDEVKVVESEADNEQA